MDTDVVTGLPFQPGDVRIAELLTIVDLADGEDGTVEPKTCFCVPA